MQDFILQNLLSKSDAIRHQGIFVYNYLISIHAQLLFLLYILIGCHQMQKLSKRIRPCCTNFVALFRSSAMWHLTIRTGSRRLQRKKMMKADIKIKIFVSMNKRQLSSISIIDGSGCWLILKLSASMSIVYNLIKLLIYNFAQVQGR